VGPRSTLSLVSMTWQHGAEGNETGIVGVIMEAYLGMKAAAEVVVAVNVDGLTAGTWEGTLKDG